MIFVGFGADFGVSCEFLGGGRWGAGRAAVGARGAEVRRFWGIFGVLTGSIGGFVRNIFRGYFGDLNNLLELSR